jgi:hypothetical protein
MSPMYALGCATILLLLGTSHAHAQLCPGDEDDSISFTSTDTSNPMRIHAWSRTRLLHGQPHPSCAGIVGVKSELWLENDYTNCFSGPSYNGAATGTTSEDHHERVASRWCLMYTCGVYQTRGRHYFDGYYRSSEANTMHGGSCGGGPTCNPCTQGYVVGECAVNQQDACGCCPNPCPLVVDRSGDGLSFSDAEDGALFDINGLRAMFWLGWPTTTDDAWLAYDRNGNGLIDDGSELFGNTRRLASGRNAEHGYEVLAELDENRDGVLDARDPRFAKLLLWGDANRNGVSEPKELAPLSSAGIKRLSVDYRESEKADKHGNRFRYIAVDRSSVDVFPDWLMPDSAAPDKD